ncbi:MAG: TlpA family protein disulfide reductase [Acidobacteriota bacterium]|nr:MAG: TlpA family protein disulfide reductase [Acidobacteriota bacterium]
MSRSKLWAAFAFAVAVLAASQQWAVIGYLKEPLPAPEFEIKDVEGKPLSLKQYRGKVVLLTFWATWCRPCRIEIPHLNSLHEEYGKKHLAVISLSVDNPRRMPPEKLAEFAKKNNINYRVAMDPTYKIARDYGGARNIPTSFLIDREGKLRVRFVGSHRKEDFEKEIKALL